MFLNGEIGRFAFEPAQPVIVTVGEARGDLDPLPTFGSDLLGFGAEPLGDKTLEQGDVLEPAAAVFLEEIAQHIAAGRLVGGDADETGALVGGLYRALGQNAPDLIRLVIARPVDVLPDLLLPRVIVRDGERHQLLERHAIVGIDVEQFWRNGRKPKALLHDTDGYEEDGRDLLLGFALFAQGLERAELVERMKRLGYASSVLLAG